MIISYLELMNESLQSRRAEFDEHVWNHAEDAFQVGFDDKSPLNHEQLNSLRQILDVIRAHANVDKTYEVLTKVLGENPDHILVLMQSVGLTRNKILTDLKGAGHKVPSKPEGLVSRKDIWPIAGQYLATRLNRVLGPLVRANSDSWNEALESINQATWPGWIRQERAKRQGHEAEGRIAILLRNLNLKFEPAEKADNPLCPDIQINGVSFDIIAPDRESFKVGFKSTVQTSNIGQFGESKGGLEVREANSMVTSEFEAPRPLVVAMVDGVGFHSNTAGLSEILNTADEFCQFESLWKAAVIVASVQDVKLDLRLKDVESHSSFVNRFSSTINLCENDQSTGWIDAGEAQLRRHSKLS
jgi:hypothetical protein